MHTLRAVNNNNDEEVIKLYTDCKNSYVHVKFKSNDHLHSWWNTQNKNSNLIYKNEYAHVPLVYRKSHLEERKKSDIRERKERKGRNGIT